MPPIAHELAKKQKEISVAEFFERNKQILGFDTTTRSVITTVKEAVDNALDACEEAEILPEIHIEISHLGGDDYQIIVEDNGPGIVKRQIPHIFARLLYGSRFHALRQSRGQQGIGISAVVLYSQLSTGHPTIVTSKIGKNLPAHQYELVIDTKKNLPEIISDQMLHWEKESGTQIRLIIKGKYVKNRKQSVYEYLKSTAIVNPHAHISFKDPDGETITFDRVTDEIPPSPVEIKPHIYGIELGTFIKMARDTKARKLTSFLRKDFSSISLDKARDIVKRANLNYMDKPQEINREDAKRILEESQKIKLMAPPLDCLSPIGEILIKRGLKKETQEISPEFITTIQRTPDVYQGNPFLIETGIVYGGRLPQEDQVSILRFANRVPLLYQQGDCVITRAVEKTDWRRYGLQQRGGRGIPYGPALLLIHVASTNVPFTSESKEAIAAYPEIEKEIRLSLQQCARTMFRHLRKKERKSKAKDKFLLISKILPQIADKAAETLGKPPVAIDEIITKIMDILWIEDEVTYEKRGDFWVTKSRITLTNYTCQKQQFVLYAIKPHEAVLHSVSPFADEVTETYLKWKISNLASNAKMEICFELTNIDKGDFDENDLYVGGINPLHVIGAEKWEGD
jgi:DNA topoisomerase-6 subunit B